MHKLLSSVNKSLRQLKWLYILTEIKIVIRQTKLVWFFSCRGGFISTEEIGGLQISGKEKQAGKDGSIQSPVRYSLDSSKMDGVTDSFSV